MNKDTRKKQAPPPLVAVGGSAGSLDELIQFFEVLPEDCGMSFVVVVHLPPNEESILPDLLQRRCVLKILHPRNNQKIAANHVYVIPPGKTLTLIKDRLQVAPLDFSLGMRTVIDQLFGSVAVAGHGPFAGIVLSGADSDGAAGLMQIKRAGGLTLVQDPAEVLYGTMPRAAIATGCADAVLRAAEMPDRLLTHFWITVPLRQPAQARPDSPGPSIKVTDREAAQVRKALLCLRQRTGRDFSCYRESMVLRHLRRRMLVASLGNAKEYLEFLRTDRAEPEALVRDLLVSVTGFFRDPEAFGVLARYIPELFKGKNGAEFVRVWVPACATGEEAYSIAMLLLEHANTLAEPPGIQIFGSDLDAFAIEKARLGLYSAEIAEAVGPERLARFFHKEAGGYRVSRELRQIVLFAEHDVVRDPAFARMDLVTCRNLLIYLNPEGQRRMMDVFEFALRQQGLLFLGASEGVVGLGTRFAPLNFGHRIYRLCAGEGNPVPAPAEADTVLAALAMEQRSYRSAEVPVTKRGGEHGLAQLQDQLESLQQRLQGTVGQPDPGGVASQELKIITQELHAALEELEINRQELRSMNAELSAVNAELSARLNELGRTNSDLSNLMNAAAMPMLFLDLELKIMWYTPRAVDLFRLIPSDVGRPLSDLRNGLEYPELMADSRATLNGAGPIEREIREQSGKWFLGRVLPYHVYEDRISGVVLTFVDITERKLDEEALRKSEEKYRSLFDSIDEGFCTIEVLFDDERRPVDYRFIEANAQFERQTGLHDAIGRRMRELAPAHEQHWFDIYGQIARTGVPQRFEQRADALGYWYTVYAFRVGDPAQARVAILFKDITARKRHEANLAFLAEVSLDLAQLQDIGETMNVVGVKIGAHFNVSRCNFAEINEPADEAVITHEWHREGLPDTAGPKVHRLRDFITDEFYRAARAGEMLVVRDTRTDPRTDDAAYAPLDTRSFVTAPFVAEGKWNFLISIAHTEPHDWREDEIELMRELATRIWARLERARAEESLRTNEKLMRGQKEAFQAAINGATLEDSLGVLTRIVTEETGDKVRTAFYIADQDGTCLHPVQGAGAMPESYTKQVDGFRIGKDSLACGLATATGRPVLTRDVFEEPLWKPWIHLAKEYDFRGCWSFPIETSEGKAIGTFAMYFTTAREAAPRDLALADVVTQAAAIIISRYAEARERNRAEEALRESEERVRLAVYATVD
jgi:PAS domain S-box-containing protein